MGTTTKKRVGYDVAELSGVNKAKPTYRTFREAEEAWEEAIDHYHGGPVVIVKVWSEVTVKKSFKVVRT